MACLSVFVYRVMREFEEEREKQIDSLMCGILLKQ